MVQTLHLHSISGRRAKSVNSKVLKSSVHLDQSILSKLSAPPRANNTIDIGLPHPKTCNIFAGLSSSRIRLIFCTVLSLSMIVLPQFLSGMAMNREKIDLSDTIFFTNEEICSGVLP